MIKLITNKINQVLEIIGFSFIVIFLHIISIVYMMIIPHTPVYSLSNICLSEKLVFGFLYNLNEGKKAGTVIDHSINSFLNYINP